MNNVEQNALALSKEAETLQRNNHNKRACFLLITALEEKAKADIDNYLSRSHGKKAGEIKKQFSRKIYEKLKIEEEILRQLSWTPEEYALVFDENIARLWAESDEFEISQKIENKKNELNKLKKEAIKIINKRGQLLYQDANATTESEAASYYLILKKFWQELTEGRNF